MANFWPQFRGQPHLSVVNHENLFWVLLPECYGEICNRVELLSATELPVVLESGTLI